MLLKEPNVSEHYLQIEAYFKTGLHVGGDLQMASCMEYKLALS